MSASGNGRQEFGSSNGRAGLLQVSRRGTPLAVDTALARSPPVSPQRSPADTNPYVPSNLKARSPAFPPSKSSHAYSSSNPGTGAFGRRHQSPTANGFRGLSSNLGLSLGLTPKSSRRRKLSRRWFAAVASFLLVVLFLARGRHRLVKAKLTTRWWKDPLSCTSSTPGRRKLTKPARHLPRPTLLAKPPITVPPSVTSHSFAQLSRLSTSYSSLPDWTAVVHLSTLSHLQSLTSLLLSVQHQSHPPSKIIILSSTSITPPARLLSTIVQHAPYPVERAPVIAVIQSARTITTDHVLYVDGSQYSLPSSYAKTLLRASGTKEYAAAVLSTGGLVLPPVTSTVPATCNSTVDPLLPLLRTASVHFPSTPFLLKTAWLTPLSNGIRLDLPIEAALAVALWTKQGTPTFALPMGIADTSVDTGCARLRKQIEGEQVQLSTLFASLLAKETAGEGAQKDGTIVLLLSGDEELALAHKLACGLAQTHDLRVYLADSDTSSYGPKIFFPPSRQSRSPTSRCHLDVIPLLPDETESIPGLIVVELDSLRRVELVIYLLGGERDREFGEVLKWAGGIFAVGQGGTRRGKAQMEREDGMVVVGLRRDEVEYSDWMATLPIEGLRHWHTPRIDLSVITNNRPTSLSRLLTSLQSAHYYGDQVSLSLNLEQTADRTTQSVVDEFRWEHGPVTLRHRILLGGLMPAIVESWYPTSNDSYGVFLEDDVEVSPFFFGWLKFSILYYRYHTPMREQASHLFGVSLYQQRNIELRPEGRQPFDAHALFESISLPPTLPYLSQIPCSWGAAYFPEVWREFHAYLGLRLSETSLAISDTIVPEIRSNRWPRSWKKYFIELVYMRGYVMLYPNYAGFSSFSTNHLEKGEHNHLTAVDLKRKVQFTVPLMEHNESILDLPEGRLPTWGTLPIFDLWGALTTEDEVAERGWQSVTQMELCATDLRLDKPLTFDPTELLCPREVVRTRWVDSRTLDSSPPPVQTTPPVLVDPSVEIPTAVEKFTLVRDQPSGETPPTEPSDQTLYEFEQEELSRGVGGVQEHAGHREGDEVDAVGEAEDDEEEEDDEDEDEEGEEEEEEEE